MPIQATERTDLPFLEVAYRDEWGDEATAYLARVYEGIAVYHDEADLLAGVYEVAWDRDELVEVVRRASTIRHDEVERPVELGSWMIMYANRKRVVMETRCGAGFSITRNELRRLTEALPALERGES